MTKATLNEYFKKHQYMYEQLARDCGSVPELTLKLVIYGKEWKQWDWAFFFVCLASPPPKENAPLLYKDIINIIDTSKELDAVMTNKQVVLSMIELLNVYDNRRDYTAIVIQQYLANILAHVFKKFPRLWTISWMWTKTYSKKSHMSMKVHKLRNYARASSVDASKKPADYYTKDACFNSFQALHYFDFKDQHAEEK